MADSLAVFERLLRELSPFAQRSFLAAIVELQAGVYARAVQAMIARGDVQGVVNLVLSTRAMDQAMGKLKEVVRSSVIRSSRRYQRDVPPRRVPTPPGAPPLTTGLLRVQFDVLDPRLVTAVREFEQRMLAETGKTLQAGLREALEDGIRRGVNPREVARRIRGIVGLAPNQVRFLANFRAELEAGQFGAAMKRELRDRRFDSVLRRLSAQGDALAPDQVERMVDAYRKRLIAQHAETAARTVMINSLKIGKKAVWQQAVDQGVVRNDDLEREWFSRLDDRVRDTHAEMHGKRIAMDEQWNVPGVGYVDYPGEHEFNCRCVEVFRVKIRRRPAAA